MPCSLIPIRIDAWSTDKSIRIVDTLLYDPFAPPLPGASAPPSSAAGGGDAPLSSSAPALSEEDILAYQVIADAEVMGMGRTVRHFTNRVDLYKPELQHEIAQQIATQLQVARSNRRLNYAKKRPFHSTTSNKDGIKKDDSVTTKHIKTEDQPRGGGCTEDSKEEKLSSEKPDGGPSQESQQELTATTASSVPEDTTKSIVPIAVVAAAPASLEVVASSCVHIRLRLAAYGTRVHDDFYVDPYLPNFCPYQIAQSLADDLNLPSELAQAIAVEIVEQLHQRTVQDDATMKLGGDEGQPPSIILRHPDQITAAWTLDQRVHISNVAQLVQQHRPEATASVAPAATAS